MKLSKYKKFISFILLSSLLILALFTPTATAHHTEHHEDEDCELCIYLDQNTLIQKNYFFSLQKEINTDNIVKPELASIFTYVDLSEVAQTLITLKMKLTF